MSTTIDERVVEMRFDNKNFENNVSTTMSSLDKLKQKLNLSGASKGLENINTAARKVDLSSVSNSAETVGLKFNAMYTIADQALRNITNSAMMYGKRIVSALTIDPIKTGFSEYETQINAVQTILANTKSKGTTMDDVNQALDTLNAYADKTIYNFTEMTRNIGTFTAAGTDLETSVKAIQGIANLAAVSGSTSQQASTAMYQLSQALSSGTVKLMDWNSVVNAGMGGQVFQDALKETARVHGVAIDDMIEKEGSFRETLSSGWLTAEILTDTLEKFTLTTDGLTESQIAANREMLRAKGYTDDQIDAIFDLGKTATDAATKVKTFTQLWDTLKEAAQSGWTQTWEIIIGDFEEAKELWTGISDVVGGFIGKISDWRNSRLEGALGSPWEKLVKKINDAGMETEFFEDKVKEALKAAGFDVDALLEKYGSLEGIFQNVNGATEVLSKTMKGLFDIIGGKGGSLFDFSGIDRVLGWYSKGDDVKIVQAALEELGHKLEKYGVDGIIGPETTAAIKAFQEAAKLNVDGIVGPETIAALEKALAETNKLTGENKELAESYDELILSLKKKSGRDMLIDSFKNIAKVLGDIFGAIGKAWEEIFNPDGKSAQQKLAEDVSGLYNLISKFHDFAMALTVVDEKTGKLNETGDKIRRTFKGVFAILDIVATLMSGGLRIAFNVIGQVLSYFGLGILDVTAFVADLIVEFHDWLYSLVDISDVLDVVVPWIKQAAEWIKKLYNTIAASDEFKAFTKNVHKAGQAIKEWFSGIADVPGVKKFMDFFVKSGKVISEWIDGIKNAEDPVEYITKGIVNGILHAGKAFWDAVFSIGGYIVEGLVEGIGNKGGTILSTILEIAKHILTTICEFFGIHSPSTVMMTIGGFLIAGLAIGLENGLGGIWDVLTELTFGVIGIVKELCYGLIDFIKGIDFGTVLAAVITGGIVVTVYKVANAFQALTAPLGGLGDMFEEVGDMCKAFGKGVKNYLNAQAVKTLSISIAILAGALIPLALMMSDESTASAVWKAVGVMGALVGMVAVMAGVIVGLNAIASKNTGDAKGMFNLVVPLLAIAGVMVILAVVMKQLSGMDSDGIGKALLGLGAIVAAIIVIAATLGILNKKKIKKDFDQLGNVLLKMSIAMIAMVAAVKLAASIDVDEAKRGLTVVGLVGLLFAAVALLSKRSSKNGSNMGSMLIKMSVAIALMIGVVKLAAGLDKRELGRGLGVVAAIEGLFIAIVAVSKLAGKNASKAGGMLLKMAIAMGIMVAVIKLASTLKADEIKHSLIAITIVGAIFAALIAVTTLAGKNASEAGTMLIKMSIALLILSGVMFILSLFKPEGLVKALATIVILTACISALLLATGKAKNSKAMNKTLIELMVVIGLLGALTVLLSFIDPVRVATGAGALVALMGTFAALMLVTKYAKNTKSARESIVTMIGVVIALAGVVYALSHINNADTAIKASAALSIILLSLSGSLLIMGKAGKISTTVSKQLFPLLGVIAGLAVILGLLSAFNVEASIPSAIALGVLLNALAVALVIMSNAKSMRVASMGVSLLALAGLVAVMALLGLVLAMMTALKVDNAIENALVLSGLLIVLVGIAAVLSLIGVAAPNILMGSLGLAALVGVMRAITLVLALMESLELEHAKTNAEILTDFLLKLSAVLVIVGVFGSLAAVGMTGMYALLGFMVAVGALAIAVGALMEKFPSLQQFLDTGIPVLEQLAHGIGSIVGNLISGFAEGALSSLPTIGTYLTDFMNNANGFIEGAKRIDDKVTTGIRVLAGAVLALTAADLIAGLASWLQNGSSFATLGTELSNFMANAKPFIDSASTLNEDVLYGIKALAEAILILTATDVLNGLTSWFTGGNSFGTFAEALPQLGDGLAKFKASLGENGLTDADLNTVKIAADAVKVLAAAASEIPNSGGWLGAIVGENDLDVFANKFPLLAQGLNGFRTALGGNGLTEDDMNTVKMAAEAVKILAAAASEIPNSGGWLGTIVGNNDLDMFANRFPLLAIGLIGFKTNMSSLGGGFTENDLAAVKTAGEAVKVLAAVASEIPNSGGWVGAIVGNNDLDTFAARFPALGTGLAGLKINLGNWTEADKLMITNVAGSISSLANVAKVVGDNETFWNSPLDDFMKFIGKLPQLGTNLATFANNLGSGFSLDHSTVLDMAARSLTTLSKIKVEPDNGSKLASFAGYLPGMSGNLRNFASSMAGISIETMNHSVSVADKLSGFCNRIKLIDGNGAVDDVQRIQKAATNLQSTSQILGNISIENIGRAENAVNTLRLMVSGLEGIDVSGVTALSDALVKLATDSVRQFVDAMTGSNTTSAMQSGVKTMVGNAAIAVTDNSSILAQSFDEIVGDSVNTVNSKTNYNSFSSAGGYLASGLAAGLRDGLSKVKAAAAELAAAAERAVRIAAKIKSPSRVFYALGDFISQGFTNALYDNTDASYVAGEGMVSAAKSGLSDALGNLYKMVDGDMNVQPTIRPILDLNDVKSGIGTMNSMLGMGSSVSVLANANAISHMMNRRSQNGGNGDVVSAIDKLRGDLANTRGDTITINGVTYDDGSNINDAVKTIVRHARIERRR